VEEEYINGDGATKMSAKCLHPGCTNRFSLQKGVGNGHMPRYIKTHAKKDEQSRIRFNPDGWQDIFVHDQHSQRDALARLINIFELLILLILNRSLDKLLIGI
jgi:hypothetical protein